MSRRGFTVIELVVALTLAGLVLLLGGAAFGVLARSAEATRRAELQTNRRRNAVRWLQRTVRSLEVGSPGAQPFVGELRRLRFGGRVQVPGGWWEMQPVELRVDGRTLVGTVAGGTTVSLIQGVSRVEFDYLIVPGLDSRWTHAWQSPVSAPLAVRLRLASADSAGVVDTLLLLVGERG